MSHYGFEIVQTLIVDIEPDERVKRAMNEINAGTQTPLLEHFRGGDGTVLTCLNLFFNHSDVRFLTDNSC